MSLFQGGEKPVNVPAVASEVYDATGAGDTVIACATLALAAGASLLEAATLANHAASIVVRRVGTAQAAPEELAESLVEGS
jgi:D-beta-D-heptose 7-phosphate kinase/D-beta-D-heptose 1-phosphate adenosyltransferase